MKRNKHKQKKLKESVSHKINLCKMQKNKRKKKKLCIDKLYGKHENPLLSLFCERNL